MRNVLMACLMAIAVNAVLIQTIATDDSLLKNAVRIGVLGLASLAMILHGSRLPLGIFLLILVSVLTLVGRQNADQLSFIFIFTLAPALFAVREKTINKMVLLSALASLGLIFALLLAGVTQNEVSEFRGRNNFGTNGVPFFYNVVYGALTMLLVYVHKYQTKMRHAWTIVAIALATHLFNLTDARGGYYAFIAFVALLYIVPALANVGLVRFMTMTLPACFLFGAFFVATLANDDAANQLLSRRPILYQRFLEDLDESDYFLSTTVKQLDTASTIVDNSYLHLLVGGGAILCLVFLGMFASAVARLYRMRRFVDVSFLVATCLYFNSESIMLRIENIFVIYFWYLIIRFARPSVLADGTQGHNVRRDRIARVPIQWPERELFEAREVVPRRTVPSPQERQKLQRRADPARLLNGQSRKTTTELDEL